MKQIVYNSTHFTCADSSLMPDNVLPGNDLPMLKLHHKKPIYCISWQNDKQSLFENNINLNSAYKIVLQDYYLWYFKPG